MSGIVVGVDRSDTARTAAVKAAELAMKTGERLHLVMAMKPGRSHARHSGADQFFDDWVSRGRQFLEGVVQELGIDDATVAIGGKDPARALCDEARRIDATMIVVGNRRAQGAARVLGSVAADVVRLAHCDVLVAHTTTVGQASTVEHSITSAKLFEGCTAKELRAIDRLATSIEVAAGQTLTQEGRLGREFGVLLSGTATVTVDGEAVATLSAGDHFGEMALLDGIGAAGTQRSATVTADTDLWIAMMSAAEFASLVSRFPGVAERLRAAAERRATATT